MAEITYGRNYLWQKLPMAEITYGRNYQLSNQKFN
jgi:hypothetical protein